jgi:2-C-methyl-D-erythritol 4-phosphate cytidylyltransferase
VGITPPDSGKRLGAAGPKAFVEVAGRPLIEWSLDAFRAAGSVAEIIVAVPPGHDQRIAAIGAIGVSGGASRSQSVANAAEVAGGEIIVVHDAARPLVSPELIDAVVARLLAEPELTGAIAATPVTDTIKEAGEGGEVERTLDRSRLWAVQTPQAFRADALRDALAAADDLSTATDDAMLVEAAGGRVAIEPAPPENLKITTRLDLAVAEQLLRGRP